MLASANRAPLLNRPQRPQHRAPVVSAQLVNQYGQPLRSSSCQSSSIPSSSGRGELVKAAVASTSPPASSYKEAPYIYIGNQRVHSLSPLGLDVVNSMQDWARTSLSKFLKPTQKHWQPADLLPNSSSPDFMDQVRALRKTSENLPNEYLVVLIGDMITEEALPSYMNMLNLLDGTKDETGADATPWAEWTRQWTAEENRHGDLLNKYLYLSGKVDMHAIEVTTQNLISSGLDPRLENNPYLCFVYTSFQERATKISHGNTARLANHYGDSHLAKMCGLIAADEGRHECAYQAIIEEVIRRDPDGGVMAFADMMRKGILMPAHFMEDNWHGEGNAGANLFEDYAAVADAIGVYTTDDYANIVQFLVDRWDIANVRVESGQAAEAQEFLCKHSQRIRRLANIQTERRLRDRKRGKLRTANFSWVFKREASMV